MSQGESQQAAAVRHQLVQLVGAHGPGLLDDSRRVRAMLGDAVVGATAEANLIGLAISSGVPARLRQGTPASAAVTELQQTSSVQPEDARWAVSVIGAALGIESSVSEPLAAPSAPVVRPASQAAAPSGEAGPDDLVIGGAGSDLVVKAGSVATIGRDPGSTVVLPSTAVSRHHAQVERGTTGWEYTDVGSTQGSFRDGAAVRVTALSGPTELTLGQGAEAVRLRFTPGSSMAQPAPRRARPDVAAAAPATEVPGRPGGPLGAGAPRTEVTGADSLTLTLAGTTRVLRAGESLTIGRELDNDLVSPGSTASRHHLRVEHHGSAWQLRDLGSSSGTWLDGRRITEVALSGTQEFVLGDPDRGDRLTTRTAGDAARPPKTKRGPILGGKRPSWLVPGAAAAAVILVLGVVAVAVSSRGGSDAPSELTSQDLAQATVKLDFPGHWSGSGVVVDNQRGLIMTNAHVAQPQAIGQGLPLDPDSAPVMSTELAVDNPNPKALVVYVSADGKSAALPKFLAEPVAWDGYLDVAVLKITHLYDGSDDATSAPVAGADDWASLPEVPLGESRDLAAGQKVGVWGYPGDPGSKAPNFGSGSLSSPVEDNRLSAKWGTMANQAAWNFEGGQILHGNSGGLAFDEDTHTMIGIPTWFVPDSDTGAPVASRMRPIDFAKPLLTAVQQGRKYVSPYATAGPRTATVKPYQYGTGSDPGTASCEEVQGGDRSMLSFKYSGFPGGSGHTDLAAQVWTRSGDSWKPVDFAVASVPNTMKSSGCVAFIFHGDLPAGDYDVEVGIGGDLHVIYDHVLSNLWS
jgi:pSer/pThr/pTyr-binding forkhead associated (FHA) protein